MPDYIADFTDGSYSAIDSIRWWGSGEAVGVATRGDGKRRVVFFQDHPASHGPLMIPRSNDPWVHNIRRRQGRTLRDI
jgi:hypothetical protein